MFGAGAVWLWRAGAAGHLGSPWAVVSGGPPLAGSTSAHREAAGDAPDLTERTDWGAVLAAFRATGGNPSRAQVLLRKLDAGSLAQLAGQIATRPPSGRNLDMAKAVFRRWGEVDHAAALAAARASARNKEGSLAREVLAGYTTADPAGAVAFLAKALDADFPWYDDKSYRQSALDDALTTWAEKDPRAVAAFLDTAAPANVPWQIYRDVAENLAWVDPAAALAWSDPLPGQINLIASARVVKIWAEKDRAGALAYALAAPEEHRLRVNMVEGVVDGWANADPQAVLRWADGQTGEVQQSARSAAVLRWADDDPAAAAAWAAQLPPDGGRQVWKELSGKWSALDPVAAERWLNGLPAGPERDQAAEAYTLDNPDPAATERWLDTLPEGFGRDVALDRFAWTKYTPGGYAAVGDWLQRISDQDVRNEKLLRLANTWMSVDPVQAKAWLDQGHLPPALLGKVEYR